MFISKILLSLKLFLKPVHEHLEDNSFVKTLCNTRLIKFFTSVPPILLIKFTCN